MAKNASVSAEDVRRVRRLLDETQAEFAKRLGVDPVTVARWETGQRRCAGLYAVALARLDPERRLSEAQATRGVPALGEEARFSALAGLLRAFFDGSTAKAVSALVERETLSNADLDALARVIEEKKKARGRKR